jgi:PEP-CTERM motif
MNSISRSILARSLMTGVASLAFIMASATAVRAQTVIGANGAPGVDCSTDNCRAGNGADGESVSSSGNPAAAFGGAGGAAGIALTNVGNFADGVGGNGGNATATSIGGPTSSATATGGPGGAGGGFESFDDGAGGNATATSTAISSGNATSFAAATGAPGNPAGKATATSSATASGSGGATASAIATGSSFFAVDSNATSFAQTAEGGLAQAQAQAGNEVSGGLAQSTAKTAFGGVSVQPTAATVFGGLTNAIAQGGSGQSPVDTGQFDSFAFSTALPNTAYATTLIGSASNVANALLGPDDKIFGTAILEGTTNPDGLFASRVFGSSSTLDFSFQGDLILGVITGGFFDIVANGIDILSEEVGDDSVINLGSGLGPNIDLTIEGDGVFAIGGAVPEPSTWAMMLVGFAGLGYAGYRRAREPRAA